MPVRTPRAAAGAGLVRTPVRALPRIHQLVLPTPWDVGPVQVYLIDSEPLTLVDTGVRSEPSRAALEAALDALGHSLDEVQRVVLTHYHADHLGQARTLREAGAELEVCAHADEVEMIEGYTEEKHERIDATSELFREYGVDADVRARQVAWLRERIRTEPELCEATRVDRVLRDGDCIGFKDIELRVLHTPGHTAGHIVLHEPASGVLLTGDHVMGGAVASTATYYTSPLPEPGDPLQRRPRFRGLPLHLEALRRLRPLRARTILPAHGGVLERPDRAIQDALLFYDVRVQRIERGLRNLAAMDRAVTAWELWKALFPDADPVEEMRNRMLMVIGALDVLEERGACVSARRDDGVLVHRHADRA